jgi:hypothetical protein
MTESSQTRQQAEDGVEQAVLERVTSWHAGSTPEIVEEELRAAADKAGLSRDDAWISENAERISTADPLQS